LFDEIIAEFRGRENRGAAGDACPSDRKRLIETEREMVGNLMRPIHHFRVELR
jgi:hypothetical protein